MKRRVIFIVLPIILVLALLASPVLAKAPELPGKGMLWEAISILAQQLNEGLESLQGQIDNIQAYLANFTEEDPVFSAMNTETELEAQIGGQNILTQGEDISLLTDDVGYMTKGNVYCVKYEKNVVIGALARKFFFHTDDLSYGKKALSVGGFVYYMWEGFIRELEPRYYTIATDIRYFADGYCQVRYIVDIRNPFAFGKTFTAELYCIYVE